MRAAVEIGRIKNELGVDPYDPAREEQVFEKLGNINSGPLHKDSLRIIYREIISASIALEKKRLARKALLEQRQKERYGS